MNEIDLDYYIKGRDKKIIFLKLLEISKIEQLTRMNILVEEE